MKSIYKNGKNNNKILKQYFGNIKIEKQKVQQHKRPTSIKNIDINKSIVSKKLSFAKNGFKCFIGYKCALRVFLPNMRAYRKEFYEIKFTSFC